MNKNSFITPSERLTKDSTHPDYLTKLEFGEIAELRKGKFNPLTSDENKRCIELEHFEQKTGKIIGWTNSSEQKSIKNVFHKGDVLFGKLRPYLCKYWLAEFDGVCSSEVWVLKTKKNTSKEYLFNIIQSHAFIQAANVSSGSKMPRADWNYVESFPITIIKSLSEQQRIAKILAAWNKAIKLQQQLIENKKQYKKAVMKKLLTGEVRFKGFETSKWRLKSLEEVAFFKNGKGHETVVDENGDFIIVNSKFISTEGNTIKRTNHNLSPLIKDEITLVMSDIPDGKALAKCFLVPESNQYSLNQRICSLKAKEGTDSHFLYYTLNRNQYFLGFNNGVSQTNLRKEEVLECPLMMPIIDEQKKIASFLIGIDTEIKALEKEFIVIQKQKQGLMQQLLTGKVRVN